MQYDHEQTYTYESNIYTESISFIFYKHIKNTFKRNDGRDKNAIWFYFFVLNFIIYNTLFQQI